MENTTAVPSAVPMESTPERKHSEHWLVEVVGGLTLANTIVSALAMFYLLVEYGIPSA